MPLFRKRNKEFQQTEQVREDLVRSEERQQLLLHVIRRLLLFLKDFTLNLEEIRSDDFKKDIDDLTDRFTLESNTNAVGVAFEKRIQTIKSYINRQNDHLQQKEKELKDIIELLTKALATLDYENEEYNQRIFAQSEKIERITQLDDIKQIKSVLREEVEQIRRSVREKQEHDRKRIQSLSRKVSSLEAELQRVKTGSLRDSLTGLYSREAFERSVEGLTDHAGTLSSSFSLVLLEIRNYKAMKEAYGPKIGDRIVLAIARQCGKFFDRDEFVARYGEEIFAVVLPGSPLGSTSKRAKELNKIIAQSRYSVDDVHEGHVLSFSVIIGISAWRSGDRAETVIGRALDALAEAKRSGRNQVVGEPLRRLLVLQGFWRRR